MRVRIGQPRLTVVAIALVAAAVADPAPAAAQTRSPMNIERAKPPDTPELVVLFEGGDYPANIARVLTVLGRKDVLNTTTVTLQAGQTVCDVYARVLRSGCTKETQALAQSLNPRDETNPRGLRTGSLAVGREVRVPSVQLTERPYFVKLDPRVGSDRQRIADLTANWTKVKQEKLPDGYVGYTFPGFELRVPVRSDEEANALRQQLRELRIPNITVAARRQEPGAARAAREHRPRQVLDALPRRQGSAAGTGRGRPAVDAVGGGPEDVLHRVPRRASAPTWSSWTRPSGRTRSCASSSTRTRIPARALLRCRPSPRSPARRRRRTASPSRSTRESTTGPTSRASSPRRSTAAGCRASRPARSSRRCAGRRTWCR